MGTRSPTTSTTSSTASRIRRWRWTRRATSSSTSTVHGHDDPFAADNGVYARRFSSNATPASEAFQVNQTTVGNQQNDTVAMDAAGDFVVSWETDQAGSYQVYALPLRPHLPGGLHAGLGGLSWQHGLLDYVFGTNPLYTTDAMTAVAQVYTGPNNQAVDFADYQAETIDVADNNGAVGGEFLVSDATDFTPGIRAWPWTPRATPRWSGAAPWPAASRKAFSASSDPAEGHRRPAGRAGANAVTANGATTLVPLADASSPAAGPTQLVVTFDKPLLATGCSNSILNLANWTLTVGGVAVNDVASVQYGLSEAYHLGLAAAPDGKYEAVVKFTSALERRRLYPHDPGTRSKTPSATSSTAITTARLAECSIGPSRSPAAAAMAMAAAPPPGNPPGTTTTDPQVNTDMLDMAGTRPAVAMDANGDYVAVWTSSQRRRGHRSAQQFNKYGQPQRSEFQVNTGTNGDFSTGNQSQPAVAMDAYGDFVVVWAGRGPTSMPASTPTCTSPTARRPAIPSRSTRTRQAPARSRPSRWTPPAISSSPGAATANRPPPAAASTPGGSTRPAWPRATTSW